jgi:recombination protein RecA
MARDAAVRLKLLDRYGPGVFTPSDAGAPLSTGYPALDAALGIGGLPRGRIVELTGDDSGKLSIALGLLATATRDGGLAAIVDPARAFYPPSAAAAGVQLANLAVVQPAGLPQALEALATLLQTEGFTALVYDLPRGGKEPNAGQLSRLAAAAAHTGTLLLVLTSTGRARTATSTNRPLGYFASVRLLAERRDCLWRAGPAGAPLELAGYRLGVTVIKHKLAAPGRSVELEVAAAP